MFVDRVTIYVKAGDGGAGCCSFRREKYVPRGGPDGGDGGDGGSVIVRARAGTDSLADIVNRKHWRAAVGGAGGSDNCHGRRGEDLVIHVPPGTLIYDRDRGNLLKDLTRDGQQVVVARGGRGGRGNRAFATAINRAPRETQPGTDGEERWLVLELKVIADAGLVGLPNAGKSTLLSRLSHAQPEIADYPFTTRHPNLGVVSLGNERVFVLADLPGLIEGAHDGVGLGHEFLRHVERTRVLIHLVEPLPSDGSDPVANYHVVRRELDLHSPELSRKPELIALSKAELTGSEEVRARLEQELGRPVLAISSATGQGLSQLVGAVVEQLARVKPTLVEQAIPRPTLVADVGNTRIKWGRCDDDGVNESVSLPPDSPADWELQIDHWNLQARQRWVISGVHPQRRDRLAAWARHRGDDVTVLDAPSDLPLRVELEFPERVGIDRLLDAVAVNSRRRPGTPAILVDAGSAVTIDRVNAEGAFEGGAILPGFRLMAEALHEYTALLPLIEVRDAMPSYPGTSTPTAMQTGLYWAIVGAIKEFVRQTTEQTGATPEVYVTGGDGPLLTPALGPDVQTWPLMTLEGVWLAATAGLSKSSRSDS